MSNSYQNSGLPNINVPKIILSLAKLGVIHETLIDRKQGFSRYLKGVQSANQLNALIACMLYAGRNI
jgi:hypothetical protein